jgi:hypothetical protein
VTGPWNELVSAALVGTERRPAPTAAVAVAEGLVGGTLRRDADERTVLVAAGVLGAHRRAGLVTPVADGPAPEPALDDAAPEAPPGAAHLLELVLDGHVAVAGGSTPVALEWLERCRASGHRVPDHLLPAVLDRAAVVRELRDPLVAAGGARLRWLAGRNPAWSWAAADPAASLDPGVWETGDGDRFAVLAALRAADPAAARELVARTWSGEKAADRARIVEVLRTGLRPDDEPFLEAALDDRAGSVRVAAADALAALPSSRLAARMADRLEPLVAVAGRFRRKLEVELPPEPDTAARRDGVVDHGAPDGLGLRAWWLSQIVAAAPLAWWTPRAGATPAEVVALGERRELRRGWAVAAARQRDTAWAEALLAVEPDPALLGVLPAGRAATLLAPRLASAKDAAVPSLLAAVPGPWPEPLSAAAVERLRGAKNGVAVEHALGFLAARADPSVVGAVESWITELGKDDRRRRLAREAAHALTIRRTIAEELR